jgi:tetratricopeptide (TPR) repeat protein
MGKLALARGDFAGAEQTLREALDLQPCDDRAETFLGLAELWRERGNHAEEVQLIRQALEHQEQLRGPDHPGIVSIREQLAEAHVKEGNLARAISVMQGLIAQQEFSPHRRRQIRYLVRLAELLRQTNQPAEACRVEKQAEALRSQELP